MRLRARATYPILEVRNPLHKTRYLVLLPMFPGEEAALCTCTDFARRGLGSCKHISAGHRWLLAHPDALPDGGPPLPPRDVGEAWDEIDRRLRDRSRGDRLDIRGVEAPGLALFGRAGDS